MGSSNVLTGAEPFMLRNFLFIFKTHTREFRIDMRKLELLGLLKRLKR